MEWFHVCEGGWVFGVIEKGMLRAAPAAGVQKYNRMDKPFGWWVEIDGDIVEGSCQYIWEAAKAAEEALSHAEVH